MNCTDCIKKCGPSNDDDGNKCMLSNCPKCLTCQACFVSCRDFGDPRDPNISWEKCAEHFCTQPDGTPCHVPHPVGNTPGICANQDSFNNSVRSAIKYVRKKEEGPAWSLWVAVGIYTLIVVWALMLVAKLPPGYRRKEHYLLAIVFSPMYVIAHYLGNK
uniref:Uncharacterized protein n=1 Tax=viral metagenome TaxID=1070528 RepID=A0A6C0EM55_9ZZZZ